MAEDVEAGDRGPRVRADRSARRHVTRAVSAVVIAALLVACGGDPHDVSARRPEVGPRSRDAAAARLATCAECHASVVESFLGHGMAYTIGPVEDPPSGSVTNPTTGDEYTFAREDGALVMRHDRADGGRRVARVMGRYGAGVMDMSFIGSELDAEGRPVGRMVFLPLERMRGAGLVLSPFEHGAPGTGLEMPFATECLRCHTTQDPADLPGVARGVEGDHVWPGEQLGPDVFEHLEPLACDACHGPTEEHARLKRLSLERGEVTPLGLERLGDLPAGRQRDVCSKCHLEGDGHMELGEVARGGPQPEDFLLRRPVLVPTRTGDDFHFVGQVHRLSMSACFGAPEGLTCTSCHDPHTAVAAQGTASFDRRCMDCHDDGADCVRPAELEVSAVTGDPARTPDGCVDCHVRRSQPFDIPGVRTADHFVRRRIPLPETMPMRELEDPGGGLRVFDDGRFAERLATPEGRAWNDVLVGLRLGAMGRVSEALELAQSMPPPGSVVSTRPESWSEGEDALPSLRRAAVVHHLRGLLYEAAARPIEARDAYSDALRVDPAHPQARLNRGSLALSLGDTDAALADAAELARLYPEAEKPWNLRALVAARTQAWPALAAALTESLARWPADPSAWHMYGQAMLGMGLTDDARAALSEAARREPSRHGLAEDLRRAGAR